MQRIQRVLQRIDDWQQRHPPAAFAVAVVKRYGDDKAGQQAALVTYYGFLSLFPLLLAFVTILNVAVGHYPHLQAMILSRVLQYFPLIGDSITHSVHSLHGSGLALAAELLVLLYGARGLTLILQQVFNTVWHVSAKQLPGFVSDNLRGFGMMSAIGVAVVLGTALSYTFGNIIHLGIIGSLAIAVLNILVTVGLYLAVFRLGTASSVSLRQLALGAVLAAVGTLTVQHFGGLLMARELPKLRNSYGSFYLALGLMFWLYLQAQVLLYSIEITAVRAQHDWPRRLL